ncbi:glycosyltransferase family 2 protein [Microbacterium trichothecenolyticum]
MPESVGLAAQRTATAAVVLAYHPDDAILENLVRIRPQVGRVYVVDNSPGEESARLWSTLGDGVEVLEQCGNVGVAAGFNAGIRAALAAGSDYVVIFDQDSTPTPGMVDRLLSVHAQHGAHAGVIAPALRSAATGVVYRRETGDGVAEVPVLISSGSLLSRDLIERIGLHDQPLFIDYVDHDFCLRARAAGLRNLKVFDALLDHRFGDSDPIRLLGRRVYLANYSTMRLFHQTRNRVIVIRRYGFGAWFWEDAWFTLKAWTKLLLFERNRGAKLGAALRGLRAGLVYPARERHW